MIQEDTFSSANKAAVLLSSLTLVKFLFSPVPFHLSHHVLRANTTYIFMLHFYCNVLFILIVLAFLNQL